MIVVDTNVIVYALVEGEHTADVRRLFKRDPRWRLPALWRYEFASALTTLVRGRALEEARSERLMRDALEWVTPFEQEADAVRALRAAQRYKLSAYDAQYVALAEQFNVRCVTADVRLLRNAPGIAMSIAEAAAPLTE